MTYKYVSPTSTLFWASKRLREVWTTCIFCNVSKIVCITSFEGDENLWGSVTLSPSPAQEAACPLDISTCMYFRKLNLRFTKSCKKTVQSSHVYCAYFPRC